MKILKNDNTMDKRRFIIVELVGYYSISIGVKTRLSILIPKFRK